MGKSALFNRIAGQRIAIVHDLPGVTRDRVSAELEWMGKPFTLVDTGGIGLSRGEKAEGVIIEAALQQVELAVEMCHVVLFVVSAQEGVVPLDREVAARLRRSGKPVLLVANKVDHDGVTPAVDEFSQLAFEKIFPISAVHNRGVGPLMDAAMSYLPKDVEPVEDQASGDGRTVKGMKLAIVGRPNVGKSSIVNALTRSERVIVSAIPGTTRDSVDVPFEVESEGVRHRYVLIDTAGIRKTRSVADSIEFFSVKRSEDSIDRADLVIFVLDAEAGILEQDKKVAAKIVEARKPCILVVNKWDLVAPELEKKLKEEAETAAPPKRRQKGQPDRLQTLGEFGSWVQETLFFLDHAPVIFTSATSGFNLERLLEAVRYVSAQMKQEVPTALLNRTLREAIEKRQPISATGLRLKFFYATQISRTPATFLLFVNRDDHFSAPYSRYLADELRRAYGFEGCPIVLLARARRRVDLDEKRGGVKGRSSSKPKGRHKRTGDSKGGGKARPGVGGRPAVGRAKGPGIRRDNPKGGGLRRAR